MKQTVKPRQIIMSKRANVFYLEHVRVQQKDERVVYLTEQDNTTEHFFNIPERNTAFLLLGKGTSITDAAIRRLADSNVVIGFVGNGGSPLLGSVDMAFLTPQSEYRPTEYMQAWMRMWLDEEKRLGVAKSFQKERIRWVRESWDANADLAALKLRLPDAAIRSYEGRIAAATNTIELMSGEAEWARRLYGLLSGAFGLKEFRREEGKRSRSTLQDSANSFIDHGNYIAYGYAAVALNVLGISFALPVLHGKTRRGALVFDVADLFKDAIVLPLAFKHGKQVSRDQQFRDELIEVCLTHEVLDRVIETIKTTLEERPS
ncbi:CRISPR-associated endonuclease Cas1 [Gammaproteobacteria bacterium]